MKLSTIFTVACLAYVGLAGPSRNKKVTPFIEVLNHIGDTSDALRNAVVQWNGLPLDAAPIIGNSTLLTRALETGIERIKGARRLHAASELKLRKPARRVASATYDTLQVFANSRRRFQEAASLPMVRTDLKKHKELSGQLNAVMCTKMGPIGRRVTRLGGRKSTMLFDEVLEIYAKKKDKNPKEDARRRKAKPKWPHITPPPPGSA